MKTRRLIKKATAGFMAFSFMLSGIPMQNLVTRANADTVRIAEITLTNPVVKDSYYSGQTVKYDIVSYGSYPQSKVSKDSKEYEKLVNEKAESFSNDGVITIDGQKYKRVTGEAGTVDFYKYEAISWKVLDVNNGQALLVSEKVLDNKFGKDEIYNKAFSKKERAEINAENGVFLLKTSDLTNSEYGFVDENIKDEARTVTATEYAVNKGVFANVHINGFCNWMIDEGTYVKYDGEIKEYTELVEENTLGIRPAIYVSADAFDDGCKEPEITLANKRINGNESTWDCIYFGEYPRTKVNDIAIIEELSKISRWENDDVELDGNKYKRVMGEDETYSYFKYELIKWRVLSVNGDKALILTDEVVDYRKASQKTDLTDWCDSLTREWLNKDGFLSTAFSSKQIAIIDDTEIADTDSIYYGGTKDTNSDRTVKAFELDEKDVYTSSATKYGFSDSSIEADAARRAIATDYAVEKGLTTNEGYGNWSLINNSDYSSVVVLPSGEVVDSLSEINNEYGKRVALNISLSDKNLYSYAGTVTSSGVVSEYEAGTVKVKADVKAFSKVYSNTSSDTAIEVNEDEVIYSVNTKKIGKNYYQKSVASSEGELENIILVDADGNEKEGVMSEYVSATNIDTSDIPSSYDLRDYGLVTSVKNQCGGTCWAYASIANIESNVLKRGTKVSENAYVDGEINFSEKYSAFFDKVEDPFTKDGCMAYSGNSGWYYGGNQLILGQSAMALCGIANESQFYFHNPAYCNNETIEEIYCREHEVIVSECYCVDRNDTVGIKKAIMENGGITLCYDMDYDYLNKEGNAIYNAVNDAINHAVFCVGWDDNYPKENFGTSKAGAVPNNDGAWIFKNSWGSGYGNDGYYYISYEDKTLSRFYGFITEAGEKYDSCYSYSVKDYYTSFDKKAMGNIYTADLNTEIKAVSVNAETLSEYNIQVYLEAENKEMNKPDDGILVYSQKGMIENDTSKIIDLDESILVKTGQKYAVSVSVKRLDNNEYYCRLESNFTGKSKEGESFVYSDENGWKDTYELDYGNAYVNVYTKDIKDYDTLQDVIKNYKNIEKGYYTNASYSKLLTAISQANKVKREASKEDIEKAIDEMVLAKKMLKNNTKIYFKNTDNWSNVYAYLWIGEYFYNAKWPGELMKDEGNGIYSLNVDEYIVYDNISFSDGNNNKTDDLKYPGICNIYDKTTNSWSFYNQETISKISISAMTDSTPISSSKNAIFTIENATNAYYTVNGGEKINIIGEYIYIKVGENKTDYIVIHAENEEYTLEKEFVYTLGEKKEEYVYFKNTSNWTTPYVYMWSSSTNKNAAWPGEKMEKVEGDVYRYKVDTSRNFTKIIFNNGGSSQTEDLTFMGLGYMYTRNTKEWTKFSSDETGIVSVEYVDDKGAILAKEKYIGYVGSEYSIEAKEFEDYELVEQPENLTGKYSESNIIVKFVYKKKVDIHIGWYEEDGKKYYYSSDGVMQTGWIKIDNIWYYFSADGVMQTNWIKLSEKWYYLGNDGKMVKGWKKISNTWYYFNASGDMATGWKKISNKWYYFKSSGAMATGWVKSGTKWYYMDKSGAMVANTTITVGEINYSFDKNGAWIK